MLLSAMSCRNKLNALRNKVASRTACDPNSVLCNLHGQIYTKYYQNASLDENSYKVGNVHSFDFSIS